MAKIIKMNDPFQDWVDHFAQFSPCQEGLDFVRSLGDITMGEGIIQSYAHRDWEDVWGNWAIKVAGDVLDNVAYRSLADRVCTTPIRAAHLYIKAEGLTRQKSEHLKKKFHSEARTDRRVVLPEIERQLRNGEISPNPRI